MSEQKATPGPWEIQVVRHGDEVVGYNVNAKRHDPAHNGEFPYFCIESRADAHLIAAAPDLLAALRRLQSAIVERDLWHGQEDELDAATRAIAKAEGRS